MKYDVALWFKGAFHRILRRYKISSLAPRQAHVLHRFDKTDDGHLFRSLVFFASFMDCCQLYGLRTADVFVRHCKIESDLICLSIAGTIRSYLNFQVISFSTFFAAFYWLWCCLVNIRLPNETFILTEIVYIWRSGSWRSFTFVSFSPLK